MAKLNELLGDKYKDGMTVEEISAALEGLNLADMNSDTFKTGYTSKADYDKIRKSFDVTASELAALKKEKQATTTKEQELLERVNALEKDKQRSEFERNLVKAGFDETEIGELAALMENPVGMADKLKDITAKNLKKAEERITAELLKKSSRNSDPPPNNPSDKTVTREKFSKMNYEERLALANENPSLYNELTKQ
jgi:uncharacterized protein YoxC